MPRWASGFPSIGDTLMPNRIRRYRVAAFARQGGRCFYCNLPMWDDGHRDEFATALDLAPELAALLRCTAEHVRARQDGGRNRANNIVAACLDCNQARHRLPRAPTSEAYRRLVRRWMQDGRWHASMKRNTAWLRALAQLNRRFHWVI